MKTQLEQLKNTHFSVLLVDRTKEKSAFNYNIKARTVLTVAEVLNAAKTLHYYNNVKAHDIYIKAECGNYYNVVVDDLTKAKLEELLKVACPALVLLSSTNNYQAIFNLEKSSYSKEQADFVTKKLNENFGDPAFSGANHYFRLADFYNKKQSNKNEKVELVNFTSKAQNTTISFFNELLKDFKLKEVSASKSLSLSFELIKFAELTEQQKKHCRREVMTEIALCRKIFAELDMSAVDFRIVQRLSAQGYSKGQIATALELFTDYKNRHSDSADYLHRTINKAF